MKKIWLYVMLMLLLVAMPGCRAEMQDVTEETETDTDDVGEEPDTALQEAEEDTENTEDAEDVPDIQEDNPEAEEPVSDSAYSDAEIIDRMDPIISGFWSWAGLRLEHYDGVQSLDDTIRGEMIAFAFTGGSVNVPIVVWEEDETYAYISPERVQEYAVAYFGVEIDTTKLPGVDEADANYVVATDDGGLAVALGDWGLMFPVSECRVLSNDGEYAVLQYTYDLYDHMEERTYSQIGIIEYCLRADETAQNGFYIENIAVTYDMVYYGDPDRWEGENIVYDSPLGYSIETPSDLAGRISIVSEGERDVIISTVCEEENYGGVLCYITANGDSYDVIYPEGMQYDSDSAEKTQEYTLLMKYLPTILSTMSY